MTLEEAIEDAFNKAEKVRMLEMMNTPIGYEERKKAFAQLIIARRDANEAEQKLHNYYAR